MTFHPLLSHVAVATPAGLAVEAAAAPTDDGGLLLHYRIRGGIDRLRLPAPAPAGPADGLWQHTCCEAFVAAVDAPEYREFNFSPSGQWAAYRFADYRERATGDLPPAAPQLEFRRTAGGCELLARLDPALLPAGQALQLGLSAVLEAGDGSLSYWALAHAAQRPDFHLRAGFVLRLNRP